MGCCAWQEHMAEIGVTEAIQRALPAARFGKHTEDWVQLPGRERFRNPVQPVSELDESGFTALFARCRDLCL